MMDFKCDGCKKDLTQASSHFCADCVGELKDEIIELLKEIKELTPLKKEKNER